MGVTCGKVDRITKAQRVTAESRWIDVEARETSQQDRWRRRGGREVKVGIWEGM